MSRYPRAIGGKWLPGGAPCQHDPEGPFDRVNIKNGRPCRKLRTSPFLRQARIEYGDGTQEVIAFSYLRVRESHGEGEMSI